MMDNIPYGSNNIMMGWGTGFFGPLIMLAVIALIIFAIFVMIRPQRSSPRTQPDSAHAINILNERFARGEIEKKEYEEKRDYLERSQ